MSPLVRGILAALIAGAFVWWMRWVPAGWPPLLFPATIGLIAGLGASSIMVLVAMVIAGIFALFCWSLFEFASAWVWFTSLLAAFLAGLTITVISSQMMKSSMARDADRRHRGGPFLD